jgi:ATP-dependent helicase HrpA
VTLTLPLAQLNQIPAARMEWLVPGLLKEKLVQLIKTLPQKIRAKLVPVPEFVEEFMSPPPPATTRRWRRGLIPPLIDYILEARGLNARGWAVTPDAFRPDALPPHFSMNYKLIDEHGRQLDMNRSLVQLRAEWGKEGQAGIRRTARNAVRIHQADRLDLWRAARVDGSSGRRPDRARLSGAVDEGETVSLKVSIRPRRPPRRIAPACCACSCCSSRAGEVSSTRTCRA